MYRLAVNLFFLINGFVYANWAARIPALQDALDLSNKQIGLILLVHAIGAFIAMPVTGYLISKYTSKKVTTLSGLLFPFFFLVIPWMFNFATILIPFFFMGMATGMMDVAMNAQAVEVEKAYKKPIMTTFHAMFSIGMVIGGVISGFAISNNISPSQHFPFVFIVTMIFLGLSSRHLFPDKATNLSGEPWIVLPKGALIGLGIIGFCCMMGEGAISDWSTNYMKKIVQSEENLYAYGLTGFAAMMTIGRLLGDKGRQIYGDNRMLIVGSFLSLIGIALVLFIINPYTVILGFAIIGLGVSNIVPIVYSIAGSMPGIEPGVGIAMVTTIGYAGFMIGPPIIGFVADISSLHIALFLLAGLFIIMTLLIQTLKIK